MFQTLTDKFQNLFRSFSKQKEITEENIADAVRQVRLALLEADVNYSVASQFVKRVKEKAIGDKVLKSLTPAQQFINIVHEELILLMGEEEASLHFSSKPSIFMLCGLQGSGKTTHAAKLALHLKKQNKKVCLVACDLQRPAAVDQLKKLASDISVDAFSIEGEKKALLVAKEAQEKAKHENYDVLIIDTAGRLHIDAPLMEELSMLKNELKPQEVIFVANATTGQDAVKTAKEFDEKVGITGTILSMLDGDARAGAAISIREITQKPLLFEGIGEKPEDLQVFNPKSMADRILGMGDIVNLVKKAQENFDEDETKKMEKKLKKASFNYEDFIQQMKTFKKMGSFQSILSMMPGFSAMKNVDMSTDKIQLFETIIYSMTPRERREQDELNFSRKKRIAKGSSCSLEQVEQLVSRFRKIKKVFKHFKKNKKMFGNLADLENFK